jgi:hypothetical protein
VTILTNADWGHVCFDTGDITFGSGFDHFHVRWTFANSGKLLRLVGDGNERLEVRLNDDFDGLHDHYFVVQGWKE